MGTTPVQGAARQGRGAQIRGGRALLGAGAGGGKGIAMPRHGEGPGRLAPGPRPPGRSSVEAVASVMGPAVMMTPVPMVMMAPMPVVVAMVPPAPVMAMTPAIMVATVAPAMMMAVLHLHYLRRRRRPRTGREGRRLGGPRREETARHQGGHRQQPLAGRHRVAHRPHVRLRFVSPHPRAAMEGRVAPEC